MASGFAILMRPDQPLPMWSRLGGDAVDLSYLASALNDPDNGIFGYVGRGLKNANTPVWTSFLLGWDVDSVDAQGLSVYGLRTGAVVAGSALMALGGAFLTMSAFDAVFFNMVAGRGWICIALVVFASWRPGKALLGALLFGAFDAFQVRLQIEIGTFLPSQVFLMLPYFLSIAALVMVARKADYPRALLAPWFKGQR